MILDKAGKLSFKSFENPEAYNKIQRAQTSNKIYPFIIDWVNSREIDGVIPSNTVENSENAKNFLSIFISIPKHLL